MNEPAKTVKTIRTVKGFIDWLEQVKGRFVLYRGLADADWEVESSAYRRIKRSQGEAPPRVFQNYIEQLLNRAGEQGFKRRGGAQRSDLELLAELQHNGAATCLIDFTENALVALWFACQENSEKAGKVVAMATDESEEFFIVTYKRLEKPIKEFLNQDKLWKWKPGNLSNRIVAQSSVFVFGEGKIEKERWHYEEIKVNANSKQEIREELKEKFGITEERLFSDFTGFSLSNAHDKPYSDYTAEDYFSLGLAFRQQGRLEKAKDAYDKALDLAPEDMRIYRNRGIAKRASGDLSGAIADFDKVLELDPEDMRAYRSRGFAKRASGDLSGAIADFDKVLELDPEDMRAYRSRGFAKRASGDLSGAIADFDKVLELDPEDIRAYRSRGFAKRASGDLSGAIADFDKVLELDPEDIRAYRNRGFAKRASGDLSGAIADFDKVIELNPEYASAYKNRGNAKRALGDEAGAATDFTRAKELDPSLEPPESP